MLGTVVGAFPFVFFLFCRLHSCANGNGMCARSQLHDVNQGGLGVPKRANGVTAPFQRRTGSAMFLHMGTTVCVLEEGGGGVGTRRVGGGGGLRAE